MGEIRTPLPTKLFAGMISSELDLFSECAALLSTAYGPIDLKSDISPWTTTDYYRPEMGDGLFRAFVFFEKLMDPVKLAEVKRFTNTLEDRFSHASQSGRRRRINLDPGYVTEAKVVLASTKDFSHRIYIGQSIYAEVTLSYSSRQRSFTALEHTYFDFRSEEYVKMFNQARQMLRSRMMKR